MEKIEVGYRNIGSVGSIEYYHKFLLYTDSNGNHTLFLPQLRGYGLIMDSFISYNTNETLKEKALELQAGDIQAIAEGFEEFSDIWSGYTELIDSMKEKYNVVGDVNLAEIDKRVWILERLTNSPTQTPTIEARLEATLKEHANETLSEALITQSVIPTNQVDSTLNFAEFKKYTIIKRNINNCKNSSQYQERFASIKKHFSTSKNDSRHVAFNNRDFKLEMEVA